MIGEYRLRVSDKHISYKIDIRRKFTQIRGNSATGKTYLSILLSEYKFDIINESNVDVDVLPVSKKAYKAILENTNNTVYLVDENVQDLLSDEFASILFASDNYFVFFTRENLYNIPVSVKEVYELEYSVQNSFGINTNTVSKSNETDETGLSFYDHEFRSVFTEDSGSGYTFYKRFLRDVRVISGRSNSDILPVLIENYSGDKTAVIVDGAAFAAYMDDMMSYASRYDNIIVYCPESFEYLLLNTSMLKKLVDRNVLDHSENYCDDVVFNKLFSPAFDIFDSSNSLRSWERLYTAYIRCITHDIEAL